MNDLNNGIDQAPGSIGRRDLLKKGAAAGAIVWTAPLILSDSALAVGGGTPECRPTIDADCWRYNCEQGQKYMPGVKITVTECPCSPVGTPPARPQMWVRVSNLTSTCAVTKIWAEPTKCSPSAEPDDTEITANQWYCVPAAQQADGFEFFFGQARNANGAIDEISDGCIISFRLDVWAGGCYTESPPSAYACESYNVVLRWDQGGGGVPLGGQVTCQPSLETATYCPTCGFNDVPGDPGCTSGATPPSSPPCS